MTWQPAELPVLSPLDIARFWSKVAVKKAVPCWLWEGHTNNKGYGLFRISGSNRRMYLSHRIAYTLLAGSIPKAALVCHSCDTPKCCNPGHLWLGTQKDNMGDASTKGRARNTPLPGESNARCKLRTAQVIEIRRRWHPSSICTKQLAHEYGVTPANIRSIVNGKTWRHLL